MRRIRPIADVIVSEQEALDVAARLAPLACVTTRQNR